MSTDDRMIPRITDQQTQAFATACYDENSIDELRIATNPGAEPDDADMRQWGIDAEHWHEAVMAAFHDRVADGMVIDGPERLETIGVTLYGRSWQSDMARDLGMRDARRIRYWASGDREIPPGVWSDLSGILRQHGQRALSLAESLDAQRADELH